ncbi:hypothetical protein TNCV_227011 [Trichonephila clavipes]|nr:hypothetical protein TNCV_227011 [Trichonephila clavipes]
MAHTFKRDPHLSQVESHKQDSSDVLIKSNRGDEGIDPPCPMHGAPHMAFRKVRSLLKNPVIRRLRVRSLCTGVHVIHVCFLAYVKDPNVDVSTVANHATPC